MGKSKFNIINSSFTSYLNPKLFVSFLQILYENRRAIARLALNDFRKQYFGSFLGLFWAFVHPAVYMFAIYTIFTFGFKQGVSSEGYPFVLYLVSGFIIWTFFSSGLTAGVSSIESYKYLVKKMRFAVSILPVVKILSTLYIHLIMIMMYLIIYFINNYYFSLYLLQVFYYIFATFILLLGFGWLTSSLSIFVKDTNQVIAVITRVGFWFTPIFWNPQMFPKKILFFLELNPAYYLVMGYRDSFLFETWFWEKPYLTLYFWSFTFCIFVLGAIVFKRLRPHFADVL